MQQAGREERARAENGGFKDPRRHKDRYQTPREETIPVSPQTRAGRLSPGIPAQLSGQHTSWLKTGWSGTVALQVLQKDGERAGEILLKAKQDAKDIDWDKIDFGTPG